jgi:hypothetical protein
MCGDNLTDFPKALLETGQIAVRKKNSISGQTLIFFISELAVPSHRKILHDKVFVLGVTEIINDDQFINRFQICIRDYCTIRP